MRTIVVPDDLPAMEALLAERARRGADVYDYEIDGVLRMSPAPRLSHANWQFRIGNALAAALATDRFVLGGPANLGRKGNYVVPDVVVLRTADAPDPENDVWVAQAAIAVEVLSPGEDEAAKIGDYRRVIGAGDLTLDELWYVDGAAADIRVYDPSSGVPMRASALVSLDEIKAVAFR